MNANHPIILKEHQWVKEEAYEELNKLVDLPYKGECDTKYLVHRDGRDIKARYYIGAKWAIENELAIVINPKIKRIDYMTMFLECMQNPVTSPYLRKIYSIDIDQPAIKLKSDSFELTPLLIIHFLGAVKDIVKRGLKRDYKSVTDNLNSKIKGKLLINENMKRNTLKLRQDRNFCRFQEYTIDCCENQLLKKALQFVSSYLKRYYSKEVSLIETFSFCNSAFYNVSDIRSLEQVKHIKTNKLHKGYSEALKLAQLILKRFSYSIANIDVEEQRSYPPFHIDMALLFELYAYTKLHKSFEADLIYQSRGSRGIPDFLLKSPQTILDTKYKPHYEKEKNLGYKLSDIRQLSAYARDTGILGHLNVDISKADIPIVDGVIIYPLKGGESEFRLDQLKRHSIPGFINFYKVGIELPEKLAIK